MKKSKKLVMKVCILLMGLVLVIGLVNYYHTNLSKRKAVAFTQAVEKYLNPSEFELALWNVTEAATGESSDMIIKWWYNPNEDKYYLFVPQKLVQEGMHWMFSQTENIRIGEQQISNGSRYDFEEGIYPLEVELPQGKKNYNLEIRYSSDIASLFLETESGGMSYIHEAKENYETGRYTLITGSDDLYYTGLIENIHCRGNVSFTDTDKKSYQIKLTEKKDLLGMGEDKHWLLLANAFDITLLRNTVAFDIAKELGLVYTPDTEYVDVYANGVYMGNYLLTEKIEIGDNRINIDDLEEQMEGMNPGKELGEYEFFMEQQGRLFSTKGYRIEQQPEDISGGYLLEIETSDRYGLEASGFLTSRMQAVVFNTPKYASYEQVSYIANLYQDFEDAIFSEDGYSPYTGAYFADYIDMNSFARKYLLEEIVKNLDAAFTSQFFYKPKDSVSTKFFAGPAWDYDKAIAASGVTEAGIDLHDPVGFYAATQTKDSDIWYALYNQEEFRELVIQIYQEEVEAKVRELANDRIEVYAEDIMKSAKNNMIRWQVFGEEPTVDGKTRMYKEKVAELSDFLNRRLDFLNQEWSVQE